MNAMSRTAELQHLLRDTDAEIARLSRTMDDPDGVSKFNMMSLAKRRERLEEELDRESYRPSRIFFFGESAFAPTMAAAGIATVAVLAFAPSLLWIVAMLAFIQIAFSSAVMWKRRSDA
jgi:hypothetical protein